MVRQLRERVELPDFGERLGGKAVNSRGADQPQDRQDCRRRLGKHEMTGVRKDGNLWRKVKFGFGLHADTKYEIPAAFGVAQASRAETKELDGDKPFEEMPLLAERCKDFGADRGDRQRAGEAVGPVRHSSVARA